MDSSFYEVFLKRIRERQKIQSEKILSGAFQKLSHYKFSSGRLEGLNEAEEVALNLYKEMYEINVINKETEEEYL